MRRALGWKRDLPDIRDFMFSAGLGFGLVAESVSLPAKIDLKPFFINVPIYDQGELGSCTAQAVGALCDYQYRNEDFKPSALFLYYVTRCLEGTVPVDSGATIRNTIKAVNQFGICEETHWPYIIKKFAEEPVQLAYEVATVHQALEYKRVRQRLDDLRAALAADFPIAFGFAVYESFYDLNKDDCVIKIPGINEEMLGGHAVVLCGYDNETERFLVRNSWGTEWGCDGYFYMPYNFVTDPRLCSDFWIIKLMEQTIEETIQNV